MAPLGASKHRLVGCGDGLTHLPGFAQPSGVRRIIALVLLSWPATAHAQAPAAADLWRVAATSLAGPPALERGPRAVFWNPAAEPGLAGLVVGAEVVHTSDVLGLSGFLVGARYAPRPWLQTGIVLARMDVRDLVRTTTSPNSEFGTIPVYEQLAGLGVGVGSHRVRVAALVRVHDARFDALTESGVTVDIGVRIAPTERLRVAAATHFVPIDLSTDPTTDYYAGAEYALVTAGSLAGARLRVLARYGVTYRPTRDLDHAIGAGAVVGERLRVDAVLISEAAYGSRAVRPALGVALELGRYTVGVARSSGVNDVGATYRIGLDVAVLP